MQTNPHKQNIKSIVKRNLKKLLVNGFIYFWEVIRTESELNNTTYFIFLKVASGTTVAKFNPDWAESMRLIGVSQIALLLNLNCYVGDWNDKYMKAKKKD